MFDNAGSVENGTNSGTVFSDNPVSSLYSDVRMIKVLETCGTETAARNGAAIIEVAPCILMLLARWFPHAAAGRLRSDFESLTASLYHFSYT